MKICLLTVGNTNKRWAAEGEAEYMGRMKHYIPFERITVPDIKNTRNLTVSQQKELEGEKILERIQSSDVIVLLDERGRELTSKEFSTEIQRYINSGIKRLVFVIGGAYGFSEAVYTRAGKQLLSFSKLTYPHDLIRVMFVEQLYRAFTILKREPYHHD